VRRVLPPIELWIQALSGDNNPEPTLDPLPCPGVSIAPIESDDSLSPFDLVSLPPSYFASIPPYIVQSLIAASRRALREGGLTLATTDRDRQRVIGHFFKVIDYSRPFA
jgi:hypothetical protein